MAQLRIRYKDGGEETHELSEKITTLGRTPANTIALKDTSTSRKHCLIKSDGGSFLLVDLGSGNGTVVNGARIKEHTLTDGDRIQLGTTIAKFVNKAEADDPL